MVVSRQPLIDSRLSTVICAPVYSSCHGLVTQVRLSYADGVKKDCCIHCDELVSLQKEMLTDFVTGLREARLEQLARVLCIAFDIADPVAPHEGGSEDAKRLSEGEGFPPPNFSTSGRTGPFSGYAATRATQVAAPCL